MNRYRIETVLRTDSVTRFNIYCSTNYTTDKISCPFLLFEEVRNRVPQVVQFSTREEFELCNGEFVQAWWACLLTAPQCR